MYEKKLILTDDDFNKWKHKFPEIKNHPERLEGCLKKYIVSLYDTKRLLKIWRHAQRYTNYITGYTESGDPIFKTTQFCNDWFLSLVLNKHSEHNLNRGRLYRVYFTEEEFKEILNSRENISNG